MTIKGSGQLSMFEINAEFGRGNDLNAYRNTQWYTDGGSSGTFSSDQISMNEFYNKRGSLPRPRTIELLIVAGGGCGGGGGIFGTGGGGGGGVIITTINLVGSGVSVGVGYGGRPNNGYRGGDSWFGDIRAYGGGNGQWPVINIKSSWGGSGGGGGGNNLNFVIGGDGVVGQGFRGGGNYGPTYINFGAGGGGAGGPGTDITNVNLYTRTYSGGQPGPGRYSDILGYGAVFGAGGAGQGGKLTNVRDGVNERGEGGSGGTYYTNLAGRDTGYGGSGLVVARYLGPQSYSGGNSIYGWNGYTIHVFTTGGTFT